MSGRVAIVVVVVSACILARIVNTFKVYAQDDFRTGGLYTATDHHGGELEAAPVKRFGWLRRHQKANTLIDLLLPHDGLELKDHMAQRFFHVYGRRRRSPLPASPGHGTRPDVPHPSLTVSSTHPSRRTRARGERRRVRAAGSRSGFMRNTRCAGGGGGCGGRSDTWPHTERRFTDMPAVAGGRSNMKAATGLGREHPGTDQSGLSSLPHSPRVDSFSSVPWQQESDAMLDPLVGKFGDASERWRHNSLLDGVQSRDRSPALSAERSREQPPSTSVGEPDGPTTVSPITLRQLRELLLSLRHRHI